MYVTDSVDLAEIYAHNKRGEDGANVMPLFAAVRNPYVADVGLKKRLRYANAAQVSAFTKALQERGFDGVVVRLAEDAAEMVAFEPTAIKSAIGNSGDFDAQNPDIRYSQSAKARLDALQSLSADGMRQSYAQARASEAAHVAVVERVAQKIVARWANAPRVVVVAGMQDAKVPRVVREHDAVQKSQGAKGEPQGFFYQGQVYLVAGQLKTSRDVARVLMHEALGHYGLRGVFGGSLASILNRLTLARRAQVVAKAREYGLHGLSKQQAGQASDAQIWQAMTSRQRLEAAEEVLAELAQRQPRLGLVREAVAAIRAWLREHVPALRHWLGEMSDDEIIREFILPARDWVQRGSQAQAAGALPAFQRAWHGSPHRGIEKEGFKLHKMGTGEGAQAYGWGMYFASQREVAEHYRTMNSGEVRIDGQLLWGREGKGPATTGNARADELLRAFDGNLLAAIEDAALFEEHEAVAALEALVGRVQRTQPGQLYRVEVPEDSDLLNYDAPLAKQPLKVRKAIAAIGRSLPEEMRWMWDGVDADTSGTALYGLLGEVAAELDPDGVENIQQAASQLLLEHGVPGLRYLDGLSRDGLGGGHNYVIWDEALLTPEAAQIEPMYNRKAQGDVLSDVQKARILQGEPVAILQGDEAPQTGMADVRRWASDLFASQGGSATNPEIGPVVLDERAVRDSMAHGRANPFKYLAFAAVKDVLEKGALVTQATHGNVDSFYISAPVKIRGVDDVVTVLVRKDPKDQRMYLHSVATKESLLNRRVSGADARASGHTGSSDSGDAQSISPNAQGRKTTKSLLDLGVSRTDTASGVERSGSTNQEGKATVAPSPKDGKVASDAVSAELRRLLALDVQGDASGDGLPMFSRSAMKGQSDAEKARILQGEPVASVRLDDAPSGGYADVVRWAAGVFKQKGGKAISPDIGEVLLNEQAARDSMAHGGANAAKKAAFGAVKDVIERGALVYQAAHGRKDSFYISAPVSISGRVNIVTALVRRDMNTQRMYLHSVMLKENLLKPSVSAADAKASEPHSATTSGDSRSLTPNTQGRKADSAEVAAELRRLLSLDVQGDASGDGLPMFSRSAMKDAQANIRRGREALAKAVTEKTSVHRAMFRNGLGWVDFVWGDEGRVMPNGRTVGGRGLAHILEARRRKDGMSHDRVSRLLDNLVQTIAKGREIGRAQMHGSTNLRVEHEGNLAVLVKNPGSNAWMLTGFEMRPSGEAGAGFDAASPTHNTPTPTRHVVGAEGVPGATVAANDANRATHTPADSSDQNAGAGSASIPHGDDQGNSPMFSRSDAAEQTGKVIGSVARTSIMKAASHKLTDWLKVGLQFLGRRHLVEIYGKDLPMAEYERLADWMAADANHVSAAADDLAQRWGKLKDEAALAELMHDATLAQIDADSRVPYAEGDDRVKSRHLKGRFDALSREAQEIYREVRQSYQEHYEQVQQAMKDRILRSAISAPRRARLLQKMDAEFFGKVKGVYFPLARFGQYVVAVRDAAGEVVSVSRAETMAEADAMRQQMRQAWPAQKGFSVGRVTLSKDFVAGRDMVGRGFMSELYGALEKTVPAEQLAELEDTLGQLYLASLPDLSWAKHGIHRKGTPGFSQDARRAFAQNTVHGARYLAKLRYGDRMQEELERMQKHVDERGAADESYDQPKMQRVVDEMSKRHEAMMNPKVSPISTALTSAGFLFYLGLSPASAMVNLTQTPLVAYPIMGGKWGFGKAAAALLRASKEAAANKNDIRQSLGDKQEIAAYEQAVRAGVIDVTMAHDLAGIAQGEDSAVMWKIRPVMRLASFMFHHAERFNRQTTFMAAYRLARQAGAEHDAAYEQAVDVTYRGHFDYSVSNRPRVMQGNVARVVLLFKQFSVNMIFTLARQAYMSVAGESPQVRKEARKVFAALMATHAMAAGVLGLPLVGVLLAMASALGGSDDEPWDAEVAMRNLMAQAFGPKASEVIAKGLSRLTPVDISGRVGLDHLIFPDVQEGLSGQRWAESLTTALLGPVVGIGVNWAKGAQKMADGDYLRALEDFMPVAARSAIKSYRYWDEGAQDRSGISIKDEVGALGLVGQLAGFSPSEVRLAFEGKKAVMDADRRLNVRRSRLLTQFAQAAMHKDAQGMQEARDAIRAFNRVNPGRRITAQHMYQSVQGRRLRVAGADNGVYLPRTRRDAMQAGAFAWEQ
ncbi:PLxRFG domain-containing protein [Comamonadaceae bacterium OH3737_COT-264]|nr:PLxRFG domain-containing protein [Comamonadaceae bacterium OH3737_COT-264]